jgi:hypothetical protein
MPYRVAIYRSKQIQSARSDVQIISPYTAKRKNGARETQNFGEEV